MISRARAVATAVLLGLPAALLAHALAFGSEHAAGGAFNTAAMALGAFSLLLIIGLHSRDLLQGSVLASRLRRQRPSFTALIGCAAFWFALLELCESAHSLPILAIAAALVVACVLIRAAVAGVAKSVATVALVLRNGASRMPPFATPAVHLRPSAPKMLRSFAHTRRLFSRPPPVLS